MWRRGKLTFVLATAQFLVIISFTLRAYYGPGADASDVRHSYNVPIVTFGNKNHEPGRDYSMLTEYTRFLTLAMGLSLALSTDFSVSGVGQALLSTVLVLQFSLLFGQLVLADRIVLDAQRLWASCNAVLSVTVACRAVHGYLSNLQLVFYVIVACISYEVNLFTTQKFTIHDMFPSMRVLLFGSLFGMTASMTLDRKMVQRTISASPNIHLLLMCSSIMEFCTWPVVFAGSTSGNKQHRIFVNTLLAESAAVVTSYAASSLLNVQNRFDVKVVHTGVTGGAVAISAVSGFMVYPAGALLIGSAGAALSIVSFLMLTCRLQPCVSQKLHTSMDDFHIVGSYCLPSACSAILSVLYSAIASEADYGLSLYEIFPARIPMANTSELEELIELLPNIRAGDGRSANDQALMQLVTLVTTVISAAISGAVTGFCCGSSWIEPLERVEFLLDDSNWHVPQVVVIGNESGGDCEVPDVMVNIELPEIMRLRTRSVI